MKYQLLLLPTCRFLISSFFCSRNCVGMPASFSWALHSRSHSSTWKMRAFLALRKPVRLICMSLASGNCHNTEWEDSPAHNQSSSDASAVFDFLYTGKWTFHLHPNSTTKVVCFSTAWSTFQNEGRKLTLFPSPNCSFQHFKHLYMQLYEQNFI